jgi:predicted thioesterase
MNFEEIEKEFIREKAEVLAQCEMINRKQYQIELEINEVNKILLNEHNEFVIKRHQIKSDIHY